MNLGASLMKQVASAANDVAGDGTTTATVLTRAIFSEGCKSVAAGMNPMDLRRGIQSAVDVVVAEPVDAKLIGTTEESRRWAPPLRERRARDRRPHRARHGEGGQGGRIACGRQTLENELEVVEGIKFGAGTSRPTS